MRRYRHPMRAPIREKQLETASEFDFDVDGGHRRFVVVRGRL